MLHELLAFQNHRLTKQILNLSLLEDKVIADFRNISKKKIKTKI